MANDILNRVRFTLLPIENLYHRVKSGWPVGCTIWKKGYGALIDLENKQ